MVAIARTVLSGVFCCIRLTLLGTRHLFLPALAAPQGHVFSATKYSNSTFDYEKVLRNLA